jgi:hypothetical protein
MKLDFVERSMTISGDHPPLTSFDTSFHLKTLPVLPVFKTGIWIFWMGTTPPLTSFASFQNWYLDFLEGDHPPFDQF